MNTKFYVVSTQRNANKNALACLATVREQTVQPVEHIFIDDASSDSTPEIVEEYIKITKDPRVRFIRNFERKYRLKNIVDAILTIPEEHSEAVVCILDGDDWLSTQEAIRTLQIAYDSHKHLEYVYTNWMYSHNRELGISQPIPSNNWNPYVDKWITSAMATFKVSAFKAIPEKNFLNHSSEYFKMGTDHAYILPLLHMLREKYSDYRAVGFIDYPLYVYQFCENEMRRRVDEEGNWERKEAHESATYIRSRGFVK